MQVLYPTYARGLPGRWVLLYVILSLLFPLHSAPYAHFLKSAWLWQIWMCRNSSLIATTAAILGEAIITFIICAAGEHSMHLQDVYA